MSRTHLTRRERRTLTRTALSALLSGMARAVTTWLLDQLT